VIRPGSNSHTVLTLKHKGVKILFVSVQVDVRVLTPCIVPAHGGLLMHKMNSGRRNILIPM